MNFILIPRIDPSLSCKLYFLVLFFQIAVIKPIDINLLYFIFITSFDLFDLSRCVYPDVLYIISSTPCTFTKLSPESCQH